MDPICMNPISLQVHVFTQYVAAAGALVKIETKSIGRCTTGVCWLIDCTKCTESINYHRSPQLFEALYLFLLKIQYGLSPKVQPATLRERM